MFANPRSGAMSQIHPHVEPFRPVKLLQGANAALSQLHHFGRSAQDCASSKRAVWANGATMKWPDV